MSPIDQSEAYERLRNSYGGSDNTAPSPWRPQYLEYNTPQKSRDFGDRDNLNIVVSGTIGAEAGASTLFFKVNCVNAVDLRIIKGSVNSRTDSYINVGIVDANRIPLNLDAAGFARRSDIHSTNSNEALERQPAGTYYFTISSSQWQALRFSATLLAISYRELSGTASGSAPLSGRLNQAKLRGTALGSNTNSGAIPRPNRIKTLGGVASGTAPLRTAIAIPSGVALGTMPMTGRLKQFHRLQGAAGGSTPLNGTLTVTRGGGGYG